MVRRLEDVLKTYDQDEYIDPDQEVFTSSEEEEERRLHQDECLLGTLENILSIRVLERLVVMVDYEVKDINKSQERESKITLV